MARIPKALLGLLMSLGLSADAAQNLAKNPNFDNNVAFWTPFGDVSLTYDGTVGFPSAGSAQLIVPAGTYGEIVGALRPFQAASRVYDLTARCFLPLGQSPETGCGVGLFFYHGADLVDGVSQPSHFLSAPTNWGLTTVRAISPAGTDGVAPFLFTNSSATSASIAHFDSVSLNPLIKGDMNDDGASDLILRRRPPLNTYTFWHMSGTTRISEEELQPQQFDPLMQLVGVDEFTGDGNQDLVFQKGTDVFFWKMNGAQRVGAPIALDPPMPSIAWRVVATGRFPALGPSGASEGDLILRNLQTQDLSIWPLNGTSLAGAPYAPTPSHADDANWTLVAAADFNADAYTDFLWYNETSGKAVIWFMDYLAVRQSGQFTNPPAAGDANWRIVAAADYGPGPDGIEGLPDIVWRNSTSGKLVIWKMDSAGNRTSGGFTSPDAPTDPVNWIVAGPR